jgi:DNA-binding beta-propeller fold protein YncE
MKTVSMAALALVAAALVAGPLRLSAAENVKLRYLASVYLDDKGTGLKRPEGVGCDGKGQFVVADTGNDRLLRFGFRDKTVTGGAEIKVPELSEPTHVELTSKGEMYVLDGKRRRVVRLGPDGTSKGTVGFDGAPPPTTIVIKSFALDGADNLYALDVTGGRVLVANAAGQFQRAILVPDDGGFISDVAVDFSGTVFVLDSISRRILSAAKDATTFTPVEKNLADSLSTPTSIALGKGVFFIVEGPSGSFVAIGRDGTFLTRQLAKGWKEGALNHPTQVCINGTDEVFVADRDNSRIQVFGLVR